MRRLLYQSLCDKLAELKRVDGTQKIVTMGLWNRQVEFIEQESAIKMPAVFIEILQTKWSNGGLQGEGSVRLHIITQYIGTDRRGSYKELKGLERFDLLDEISSILYNFQPKDDKHNIYKFYSSVSNTNSDHSEIIEDIEEFTFSVVKKR